MILVTGIAKDTELTKKRCITYLQIEIIDAFHRRKIILENCKRTTQDMKDKEYSDALRELVQAEDRIDTLCYAYYNIIGKP